MTGVQTCALPISVKDYSEYRCRKVPAKSECWRVGDSIYVKDGDEYVLYKKDRKKLDYGGLIKEANRK